MNRGLGLSYIMMVLYVEKYLYPLTKPLFLANFMELHQLRKMNRSLLILFFIAVSGLLSAQISFTDQSGLLPSPSYNGVAMAVVDVNGDHLDDIIHLDDSKILMIEFQQADGSFSNLTFGAVSNNNQWSLVAADVDENGYKDVLCGGSYDGAHLVTADASGTSYSMSDLPGSNFFMQGSCFLDFNNDGAIDAFSCHDDGESRIWENDGSGNLTVSSVIDFDVSNTDDSGNYGVLWTDFDLDGDLDLYIAKCRQGVTDPTDPRRINVLFENDGNYNFTENAAAYGLDINTQSWTADFGDYDNDGDFDIFLTSHDSNNQLLNNNNGVYTDVAASSGIGGSQFPLQAVFVDFDNDGWLDIFLAGAEHELYHNNQDGTFTLLSNPFDNDDIESYALGDLNNDGFTDIYAGYANIYTNPSNIADKLWLNEGNSNNYIGVNLKGTVSNIDAIGALVTAYGPWGQQIREVRAGASYGIMNSLTQIIGLGTETQVDSIVIQWPSGIIDVAIDPDPNQCLTVIEDICIAPNPTVEADGPLEFCSGDDVTLTAVNGTSWLWSTNETTQSITVSTSGSYSVTVFDGAFCSSTSSQYVVAVDPEEEPTITISGNLDLCETESVTLTSSEAQSYLWSNNMTGQSITVSSSGEYYVETVGICDTGVSESVTVNVTDVEEPTTTGDTVTGGMGVANLSATGDDPIWYDQEVGGTVVNTGNTYDPFLTVTTSFWVADQMATGIDTVFVALPDSVGHGGGENSPNFNGALIFDANQDFELLSVLVYAYGGGNRTIELRESDGTVIESITVNVPDGESRIDLNFNVPQGSDLELGTDADPSLHRSGDNISYPYDINGVGEIHDSSFGQSWYYYFYDWEVKTQGSICESQRVEVIGTVIPNSIDEIGSLFSIYPNPTEDIIWIESLNSEIENYDLNVVDVLGKTVIRERMQGNSRNEIDLSELDGGVYFLNLIVDGEEYTRKIIKN